MITYWPHTKWNENTFPFSIVIEWRLSSVRILHLLWSIKKKKQYLSIHLKSIAGFIKSNWSVNSSKWWNWLQWNIINNWMEWFSKFSEKWNSLREQVNTIFFFFSHNKRDSENWPKKKTIPKTSRCQISIKQMLSIKKNLKYKYHHYEL